MMLVQSIILLALATKFSEMTGVGHGVQVMKTGCSINSTLVKLEQALERLEENQCGVELKIDDIYTKLGRVDGRQCSADSKLSDVDNKLGKLEKKLCSVNSTVVDLTKQLDMVNQKQDSMGIKLAILAENQDRVELRLEDVAEKQVTMEEKLEEMHTLLKKIEGHVAPYADCADAYARGMTKSGIYEISPDGGKPFMVFCDQEFNRGGWTMFQRRKTNGTDFYRVWSEYKIGFGELEGDHWLGNDYLHRLTKNRNQEMTVHLQYPDGEIESARYSSFAIESEENKYQLKISGFIGDTPPGDSMIWDHNLNNMYFSTKDRDNDDHGGLDCAQHFHGAWWYQSCSNSNLNGGWDQIGVKVVFWWSWDEYTPLLTTTMLLRGTSGR